MPVLRAYKHVPSFQAVEAEANEILLQLKEKLRTRLQALDVPPAEVFLAPRPRAAPRPPAHVSGTDQTHTRVDRSA